MKIAITGGTGFVGRHLARALVRQGHQALLVARGTDRRDEELRHEPGIALALVGTSDADQLTEAFSGCDGVAHCAGINHENGAQTYEAVHLRGTEKVLKAMKCAGVKKIALLSFLRARPNCGSLYHESKWAAEQMVRGSGLDYTILKAGVIYGKGDHMLDHLSHAFHTFPVFGLVGMKDTMIQPVAVEDVVRILQASLVRGKLSKKSVAVLGPEKLSLKDVVRRVATAAGKKPLMIRLPVAFHYAFGWLLERVMPIPLVSTAQVRILSEGIVEPWGDVDTLPAELQPAIHFSTEQINRGLPKAGGFGLRDFMGFHL